jgi:hypothetical protein
MSDIIGRWIPSLDPLTGTLTLPLWVTGALAALFVVFCVVAFSRAGMIGGIGRIALVIAGVLVTWFLLEGRRGPDIASERRGLEQRADALAARAMMPGSALACLDSMAGETVESACERTLFATPETVASAVSYVAGQIQLLTEVYRVGGSGVVGGGVFAGIAPTPPMLADLRRAVETDRYGLVAHVLATRDGCTAERCAAFALMRDPQRVSANLSQRTYDAHIARYSAAWPATAPSPTANAAAPGLAGTTQPLPGGTAALAAPVVRPPGPGVFFPSADSIPPVNIMTSEPAREPDNTGSAPAAARTPPRRPPTAPKQPIDLNAAARGKQPAPQ